ncbi:MAG: type VI secretion system ATPase TssH [Rouxiella aceris]|uniref:type VI secretion system ATPase TssH n=1 Tax=Rouxiella aceris TaxID=2703884 RepID=UPI00283BA4FB|nr:type VI secretion system ATPase TssH [Rouxiella aceris]MDR3434560.1 type VI secretion system ATPase TssH [Rouxiella aceris]
MYQREKLFSRLGDFAYQSVVKATRLCGTFRHEYVELEHLLKTWVDRSQGDVPLLCAHYDINLPRLNDQLDKILSCMPGRSSAVQDLSARLELAIERGLLMSQVADGASMVRTAHILLGILQDSELQRWLYRLSSEFKKIPVPQVFAEFADIVGNSREQQEIGQLAENAVTAGEQQGQQVLAKWCSDLTQQAREGEIDPVIGRDSELRQLVDILLRRRQNNPILVGEAGVGKTAVVEALASQLAQGNVPPQLKDARLLSLDLGRMQAGASMRGEFESRLKALIDAIAQSPSPIILFCDEAHTLVGAGGQAGTGDAVNLLKPMLARGSLRMIAATTWSEYKQFIEPDAALTRRFQRVLVDEPAEEKAIDMLRGIAPHFARHHGVIIRDAAIRAAVRLSLRNLPTRQLPDKAISLLDTACARVSLSQHIPAQRLALAGSAIEVKQREITALKAEITLGAAESERLVMLEQAVKQQQQHLQCLAERNACEQRLVAQFKQAESQESMPLQPVLAELAAIEDPLVHAWVDEQVIADVLSDWTGIPSGRMIEDDLDNALNLESLLGTRVFGQAQASREIAQAVRMAHAGIQPPEKPLGVFLLAGPTGTGKTETATALAEAIYSGAHNLITFNMSEFQEAHTVSTLKGAPPGYVGYGKGGKLTEAVRRKPYSVILLDEFDKAHGDVHDIFYQVFDKGWMEDGEGRIISFRQCFILVTCNQGGAEIEAALAQQPDMPFSTLRPVVYQALLQKFSPALLARMNIIPYVPLNKDALVSIAEKHLHQLKTRLKHDINTDLVFDGGSTQWLASKVQSHPNSGRAIEDLLRQTILPVIGNELLQRKKSNTPSERISLQVENSELCVTF